MLPPHKLPLADVADLGVMIGGSSTAAMFRRCGVDATEAVPEYVRFKPGESLLVSYMFSTPRGAERGYVIRCADSERARTLYSKACTLRPREALGGPGVVLIDDHTVMYGFPNDARLRRLRWYTSPRKLKRSLDGLYADGRPAGDQTARELKIRGSKSGSTVIRYKPERRVVCDVTLRTRDGSDSRVFLRYSTRGDAAVLAESALLLREAGLSAPAPLAQFEQGRVSVDTYMPGLELR